MRKDCSDCGIPLDASNCYSKGKARMQSYCKKCLCKRQMNRWIQRKKDAITYKGGRCIYCGYNTSYAALDFHHRSPDEKQFDWGRLRLRKWADILVELDKCDLLCRNCHAEHHSPNAMLVLEELSEQSIC
jgi:hypothetical protein